MAQAQSTRKNAPESQRRSKARGASRTKPRHQRQQRAPLITHTRCPWCGMTIRRSTFSIRQHAFNAHRVELSEPDASHIASPERARKNPTASKAVRKSKSLYAVPAGLPSLGKRR